MRKIDDNVLIKMIKEKIPRKTIAKHFSCSEAAISKKLKRLIIPPESFENLSPKEKIFVISKLENKSNVDAAMSAYECTSRDSAKSLGHNLMKTEKIASVIEEMHNQGLTIPYRLARLRKLVDHPDPNAALKALDMSFKLDSSYAPEKHMALNVNVDISPRKSKTSGKWQARLPRKL